MNELWIIAKYAADPINARRRWSLDDSISGTHTGMHFQIPKYFKNRQEAERKLAELIEYNPGMGYGVVKVER